MFASPFFHTVRFLPLPPDSFTIALAKSPTFVVLSFVPQYTQLFCYEIISFELCGRIWDVLVASDGSYDMVFRVALALLEMGKVSWGGCRCWKFGVSCVRRACVQKSLAFPPHFILTLPLAGRTK